MLKNNVKKIIICLISITMVIAVASKTLATDNNGDVLNEINNMLQNKNNTTISENTTPEKMNEIPEGNKALNNTNANTNSNTNQNAPTTTPYTGIGDYSSVILIVIFAVSAVYAYKKIKDYNV